MLVKSPKLRWGPLEKLCGLGTFPYILENKRASFLILKNSWLKLLLAYVQHSVSTITAALVPDCMLDYTNVTNYIIKLFTCKFSFKSLTVLNVPHEYVIIKVIIQRKDDSVDFGSADGVFCIGNRILHSHLLQSMQAIVCVCVCVLRKYLMTKLTYMIKFILN